MKRAISFILTISLCISLSVNSFAARSKEQIKKEQAETQRNLEAAEEEAADIAGEKSLTEEELNENREQLARVIASVEIIEEEIKKKEKAVEEAEKEYEEAKKREEEQYIAMKRRIRYIYEHGGSDNLYAEFLSGASNFAEMLNRSVYAEEIYEYDRNLLEQYQEARLRVKESEERLKNELDELNEIKNTYEEESAALEEEIERQKEKVEDFDAQLASARAKASQYKNQIAAQNAEIKRIADAEAKAAAEKKKAEEAARKKAEAEERKRKEQEAKKKSEESKSEDSGEAEEEYAPEDEGEYEEEEEEEKKESSGGGSSTGREIAAYAQKFLGNPYVSGGTSLTDGTDCSGFTMSVYAHFGYSIPRTSWEQQSAGKGVSYSDAQPGDIFCYSGHVGIYIGNNTICHASTPETGIKLTPATYRDIITIRRIV